MNAVAFDQDVIVSVSPGLLSTQLASEIVILNMGSGIYFGLDPVGARIWELVQNPISVADASDAIESEYEVDAERCERDVADLLHEMHSAGLIQIVPS